MKQSPNLTLVTDTEAYFHELISSAISNQKVKVRPEIEVYLVGLLNQFMVTENLFARDERGSLRQEPLALMLKEALEESEREAQRLLFRHVGDVSLYIAGFFQESLMKKLVDVDYYIQMGGRAYLNVVSSLNEESLRKVYQEMAERFGSLVGVLSEVSEKTTPNKKETDLFRLYEIWLSTGSERAQKVLAEAGINPTPANKNYQ